MSQDFSSDYASLIDQRIGQKGTRIRALVLRDPYLTLYRSTGSANTWVTDLDVGSDNVVREVIIKAGSGNSRSFARKGMAVFAEQNENGRWIITGPAERRPGTTTVIEVDQADNNSQTSQPDEGFDVVDKPYSFYATVDPVSGNTWYGESTYQNFRVLDSDGNEVL